MADADPFADFPPAERRKLMRALKLRTYAEGVYDDPEEAKELKMAVVPGRR